MNIVFFIFMTMILLSCFIPKVKKISTIILLLLFISLLIIFPELSLSSAKDGINLWVFIVTPSLLPFFIVNDMLISLKFPEIMSKCLSNFARLLFNTSGYGAYVFVMSIFSGYPAGAKITEQLIRDKKITYYEGQQILTFSSTSGPLFIIGAVGSGMLGNSAAGYFLYLCHILGAITNGIIFRFLFSKKKAANIKSLPYISNDHDTSSILSKAILNSFVTCGFIGGYIILFSVIINLLNKLQYFETLGNLLSNYLSLPLNISNMLTYTIESSLEISNGSKIISTLGVSMESKLIILSFIIAFSGLSIIGQVSSIVRNTKINMKKYILAKLSHGIISALICFLFMKFNIFSVGAYAHTNNLTSPNLLFLIDLLLIIMLLINIYGRTKFFKK